MNLNLTQLLRSRGLALAVHLLLWVLLYLTVSQMGTSQPPWTDERSYSLPAQDLVPIPRMGPLFSPAGLLGRSPQGTNDTSLFFTLHFVPPVKPVAPPPTTAKIPVTYLGFYEAATGTRKAIFKAPAGFAVVAVGGTILTNFVVAEAGMQTLLLTNAAAQTNLLLLNTEKALEVPLK